MMGLILPVYAIPALAVALVGGLVASRGRSAGFRRGAVALSIAIVCGVFAALRTDGVTGETGSQIAWRWTPTPEERLLARAGVEPLPSPPPPAIPALPGADASIASPASAPSATEQRTPAAGPAGPTLPASGNGRSAASAAEWPGFRGPRRDSVATRVRLETDWETSPPIELWRRPIGPGWSSFAVQGSRLYTQEQRGDDEIVACYDAATGAPIWMHRDTARFYESNGGAGPRGTPAISGGRVFALGATGIVNALDARDGRVIWSRNGQADTEMKRPGWGFSGSPLAVGDQVLVAVSGRLIAYDAATGTPRWTSPAGGGVSYSSPQLMTIDGVEQIVLLVGTGAIGVSPADGQVLWQHQWEGVPILQPLATEDGDLLIASGDMMGGMGIRRLTVKATADGWTAEERWTTRGLKPYFNDFVVHESHAYGFDGSILAAIDLADGHRTWKGGRYGNGQMLLLPDQDLLLVISEEGELALVNATPDRFTEVARFAALEGKTWNHPVVVGDVLYVRNGEEMAAFRLPRRQRAMDLRQGAPGS
jgi:hypothetical protein